MLIRCGGTHNSNTLIEVKGYHGSLNRLIYMNNEVVERTCFAISYSDEV